MLRLDVNVVSLSLCHVCFRPTLKEWLRLDVMLVYVCFRPTLKEGLRLDVRSVSLSVMYVSLPP